MSIIKSQFLTHITEQKPDHHWRTETPNIIWDLKLNSFSRDLYAYYKKVAGDDGYCETSSATIQKILGMSPNTITKYRKILEQPHELLGGKPLIVTSHRTTEKGDPDTVYVQIVNIWRENGDNERVKKEMRDKKQNMGTARDAGGVPQEMREGTSRDANKEEPIKKNLEKNNNGFVVVSFSQKTLDMLDKIPFNQNFRKKIQWMKKDGHFVTEYDVIYAASITLSSSYDCAEAFFTSVIKNPEKYNVPPSPGDREKSNKEHAKNVIQNIKSKQENINIELFNTYLEIGNGLHQPSVIKYDDCSFKKKLQDALEKWRVEV